MDGPSKAERVRIVLVAAGFVIADSPHFIWPEPLS